MSQDSFSKVEDQFFLLKGQLETGRITREQFDAALRNLMIQDGQGRYWMIGADSGKWYVHNGKTWVESNPASTSVSSTPQPYVPAAQLSRRPNSIIWLVIASVIVCLLGAVGLLLAMNQGIVKMGLGQPTNTPYPIFASLAPTFTRILPVVVPTIQPTELPATQVIMPTVTPINTVIAPMPTEVTATPISIIIPTTAPTATPIPPTPTVAIPPGLYVASVRLEPPIPGPGEDAFFYVTFLNTGTGTANYRWLVYIYKPENTKNSFGETSKILTSMPIGTSEHKVGTWKVTRGACGTFLARVAWVDDANVATLFNRSNGQVFELTFNMCQ